MSTTETGAPAPTLADLAGLLDEAAEYGPLAFPPIRGHTQMCVLAAPVARAAAAALRGSTAPQQGERAELVDALRPLAEVAPYVEGLSDTVAIYSRSSTIEGRDHRITVADVRRAAAVLAALATPPAAPQGERPDLADGVAKLRERLEGMHSEARRRADDPNESERHESAWQGGYSEACRDLLGDVRALASLAAVSPHGGDAPRPELVALLEDFYRRTLAKDAAQTAVRVAEMAYRQAQGNGDAEHVRMLEAHGELNRAEREFAAVVRALSAGSPDQGQATERERRAYRDGWNGAVAVFASSERDAPALSAASPHQGDAGEREERQKERQKERQMERDFAWAHEQFRATISRKVGEPQPNGDAGRSPSTGGPTEGGGRA